MFSASFCLSARPPARRLFLIAGTVLLLAACSGGGIADEPFFDPAKFHHTADGFRNPPDSPNRSVRPFRFLRFIARRFSESDEAVPLPENHVMPRVEAVRSLAVHPSDARITWIGHATFLIGLDGLNILSDPFFSERASPVSFAGPKRYAPPGLALGQLPKIDAVIISHNHYDSLDKASFRALARHSPGATVLVPLGLAHLIRKWGMTNIREVDWYDEVTLGEVSFVSTPAIHRSNRGFFDINESLWNGFLIRGKTRKIWFVGDTGLGPVFEREVAPRLGPVDIALVPIGAFLPRDFMGPVHVQPSEAIQLARIMGARQAIAMHWGTLPLGSDKPIEGRRRFLDAPGLGVEKIIMRIGETRPLD